MNGQSEPEEEPGTLSCVSFPAGDLGMPGNDITEGQGRHEQEKEDFPVGHCDEFGECGQVGHSFLIRMKGIHKKRGYFFRDGRGTSRGIFGRHRKICRTVLSILKVPITVLPNRACPDGP